MLGLNIGKLPASAHNCLRNKAGGDIERLIVEQTDCEEDQRFVREPAEVWDDTKGK